MTARRREEQVAPAGGRHFVRRGPSRRWMAVFCSLLVVSWSWRRRPHLRGHQDRAAQPRGAGRVDGDRPRRPGLRGVPRADPHARDPARRDGLSLLVAVLSLNSGDVGGSVLLVSPDAPGRHRTDAFSLAAIVAYGLDPVAAMLPSLQAGSASASPRSPSSTTPGGPSWWRRSRRSQLDNPSAVGDVPGRADHAGRPTRSARTSPRVDPGESPLSRP